jgi:esterase/lipase
MTGNNTTPNSDGNVSYIDDNARDAHQKRLSFNQVPYEDSNMSEAQNAEAINGNIADVEKRFSDKASEIKRYVIGTGMSIAGLILAGFGLVISVQQIYGTGQERVADSHYETLVTRLTSAEEYFKATGERQDLFKESVNNSVKSIVGDVKDNKQVIATLSDDVKDNKLMIATLSDDVKDNKQMMSTILEQQQRTNATLDKLVAEKK